MYDRTTLWMTTTAMVGLFLFYIANYTNFFGGLDVVAGLLQLAANLFVFLSWKKGFLIFTGFKKFVALIGVLVPIGLAAATLYRVLIPFVLQ